MRVRSSRLVKPRGSSRRTSRARGSARVRGPPNRSPGIRVPAGVISGAVRVVKARAPVMGLRLIVWAPGRRRLAGKPICRRSGRLVSRLGMPKPVQGSLMVVSVRRALPSLRYCLIFECLQSMCRLGTTPLVMTRVRNRPGVAERPLRRILRAKIKPTWSGRPMSRLSRMTCPEKIRPSAGLPSTWVRENSACKMDSS